MLFITQHIEEISYSQLMYVYEETNRKYGESRYAAFTPAEQLFYAEQDLYSYLQQALKAGGWFAAWVETGKYMSALRLEPYEGGWLITALETVAAHRRKGYANALLQAVTCLFEKETIYSHVFCNHRISMRLHEKNGFVQVKDHAVLLDGTLAGNAYTYMFQP